MIILAILLWLIVGWQLLAFVNLSARKPPAKVIAHQHGHHRGRVHHPHPRGTGRDLQMTTPANITALAANEIFVFGSNAAGHHAGGAARVALDKFGAIWGQGEGLQGQTYAIPTMEGIAALSGAVVRFLAFATVHPELTFLVTAIGTGIAGHTVVEIAPLFKVHPHNVRIPAEFEEYLLGASS